MNSLANYWGVFAIWAIFLVVWLGNRYLKSRQRKRRNTVAK